ncbi:uncharacterized protein LOC121418650 [Lytechinus variegatus]|uniref:uncharacterized protein LOC121418650 n=1 Tax=Lytechinus variegatus TaxID=7654 RepID=UPI001BB24F84|nr:uncharacterized protein LOC121418650 [Lytechinus variegatus]
MTPRAREDFVPSLGRGRGLASHDLSLLAGSSVSPAVGRGRGAVPAAPSPSPRLATPDASEECEETSSKKKRGSQKCPMRGCGHRTVRMQQHLLQHLPEYFRPRKVHSGPRFREALRLRRAAWHYISQCLLGDRADEFALVEHVNSRWHAESPRVSQEDLFEMRAMIDHHKWPRVDPALEPRVNTPAALIHYRPLVFLLDLLSDTQRKHIVELREVPGRRAPQIPVRSAAQESVTPTSVPPPVPQPEGGRPDLGPTDPVKSTLTLRGFDSHFHPDGLHAFARQVQHPTPMAPGRAPVHCVNVEGGVKNYCFPEFFTNPALEQDLLNIQEGAMWKIAVGIHPKQAHLYTRRQWDLLMHYLAFPRVIGLSEVGLDHTMSPEVWRHQEALLYRLLSLGTLGKVLIMHIRGSDRDRLGKNVYSIVLKALREKCLVHQRIHLHCFTGDLYAVREWTQAFPHCYFGITGYCKNFSTKQRAAVREIPRDRLLLETASPHLKVHPDQAYNTPAYLGDVGQLVATYRGTSLTEIMTITFANGLRLYG